MLIPSTERAQEFSWQDVPSRAGACPSRGWPLTALLPRRGILAIDTSCR